MTVLDTRPILDRWTAPEPPIADTLYNLMVSVQERVGATGSLFAEVAGLLRDSSRIDTDDCHDDELRRLLDEVVTEVRDAVDLLDRYADTTDVVETIETLFDEHIATFEDWEARVRG